MFDHTGKIFCVLHRHTDRVLLCVYSSLSVIGLVNERESSVVCCDPIEKAAVAEALWMLNCVPVFLSESVAHQCYYQFCKGVLWPVGLIQCVLYLETVVGATTLLH